MQIDCSVGDLIEWRLNRDSRPGYRWLLVDNAEISTLATPEIRFISATYMSTSVIFTFQLLRKSTMVLQLVNRRRWGENSEDHFESLHITVK